jgi:hypothetical protein
MRPNNANRLAEYVKSGHRSVEGWLSPGAIAMIDRLGRAQDELGIHGNIAEIGVFRGKLFIILDLLLNENECAVALDTFEGSAIDFFIHDYLDAFLKNLDRFGAGREGVKLLKGNSTAVTAPQLLELSGGPFRLFSVDGGHDAVTVHSDMKLAIATLADGGIIIADDYFNEEWPGVSEGINRLHFEGGMGDVVPFAIGGNKLLFTQGRHAGRYTDILTGRTLEVEGHNVGHKFREMFGERVVSFSFREKSRRGFARTILKKLRVA